MVFPPTELGDNPKPGQLYRVNAVYLRARPKINEQPGWGKFWEMIPNDTLILVLESSDIIVNFSSSLGSGMVFNAFPTEFRTSCELISEGEEACQNDENAQKNLIQDNSEQ